ncbi:ankyrin-2 isoform X2 [Nasonia vitripennis]|uniref:ZU5 domain-containing protein n=1 Tax=Nasonia vitripennis TaxID=7425 RepID=A0A7M7M6K9_NASVI|nr:ankyrin-2 isoform X2 [Nasonia vitripennis]
MPEEAEEADGPAAEEIYPPIRRLFKSDATTSFLRAARSGNLEKVIEHLDTDLDINTANSNGLNALHLASKDGHVEIVTELLKRGAKVDAATKKGNTALHIASLAGQSEIVNILIQYGAAVNIQSQNGFTPLYMAAQENHDQVVKILLNNGANQSLATEDGFTPLAVAMQQGHDKVVSVLLENDSKGKVRLPALHIAAKKDDCKAADLLLQMDYFQNDHKPDVTSKSGFTPLHIAAHYGNEDIARLLIKRGADVNYLAKHNISPLHVAAKWGKNNMVKILLESGAVIDAKTRDGLTPLHCAARSGHEQCVSTLLENSAPISARTKNGLAPLHMASQGDHVDAARVLLYHRAPVDEVTIDYLTSLHVAAHCGHVRVAKLLLDRKADPNARALNGFTPLHIACKKNRIKVVELLLKHGASIESTTESGLTPLHVASFMGCMNIVIFLLQHEANPDVPTVRGETPLHLAARANQTDIIRILLRNGAKVDARAREQQTPLHIASRLGNVDIVMLLLQHGAAVDTTTKDMYTALHIAAKEGQEEVAAILVDNNASVKATTKNGFTPLHVAAKYGNMNVAKILLQKDSKLDAQGKNDITPLLLACHYDHPNVAQLLLEKGASPHLASQNGQTPLHIAARKNQMDIASTLLEHGAKANVESKAGFTPLHLSAQKGHYDMTNLLIEHGADPNHKAKNGLTALHLCAQEDFIRVASILVKNGANVESETETGYRPIHVAAHFGNLSMIRFLLKHSAEIDVKTKQNYTPLHQAAQQGHAHIVSALIEGNASHRARTNDGLTALNIAQKLGYISVMEVLKGLSYDGVTPDNKNWEEKYKVIAPESLQETSLMSDSDDEGGSDALISEQPYRYLTADLMKSLRDDSLPIDVTRDDPVHRQLSKEEHAEFVQSNNYCAAENFDSNDFARFLVSFLVDARGGTMKGCRHSGIRLIVPPRRATMPIRVTCRLVKPSKMANPPPLMEGESLATRIIEMGPVGASFLGPVLIDIPHFASVEGKEREIIILRSENGENWKEHDNSSDNDDTLLNTPYDPQMSSTHSGRITRILTTEFPQYFAIVTRIKQEVHVIGAEGGILISSVANQVQAVFPPGALTKKIKVGLQAHVIPAELTAKLLGNCVAVSPVITIEPRRRKFHKPISLTLPVPQAANKGMINHYGGETPTLRLLCSIAGGISEAQWEDVTGSTPLNFMNDKVSFTTTVSARFWLMDCRNIQEVPKMATDLYRESLFVPFITNFVIYSKRMEEVEATLRILCMTDSKEGIHTLEKQEEFAEIVKSRDVETLDGKDLYIEFSGNLIPVTKSGVQLKFTFHAFRQNRLSFHVKVKDPQLDPVARMMFMREPKVVKGEPAQQPLCVLNIVLPEITYKEYKAEDSNIISQKLDILMKSSYGRFDYSEEKRDQPKRTSPTERKFITDTLVKEQTDSIGSQLDQKGSLDLPLSPSALEKKTYSEKRRFWEDMARSKRESFQRSESEVSHTSQLTYHDSDSECLSDVREVEDEIGAIPQDPGVDMSEASVAEKAHYFEEQIQREMSAARGSLKSQSSQESARIAAARLSGISISSEDERSLEVFEETERILEEKAKQEMKEEKKDDVMEKRKSKEEKDLFGLKSGIRDKKDDVGKKDERRKSFGKKQDSKEEKTERRASKGEKDLKAGQEKKDSEKKTPAKVADTKHIESTVKSKLESDLHAKETKVDKTTGDKVDLPETKKSDAKAKAKAEPEKESKAKATKMQENVTKQQKVAESRSPVAAVKSAKEASPKSTASKQKETSPKPVPARQKSKDEPKSPLSKSPPKKAKEDLLSRSPPKKDKSKDDIPKFSPKADKAKEPTPVKMQAKADKGKTASPEKSKPVSPEKSKPVSPEKNKAALPDKSKSTSPEKSKPISPTKGKPASPEKAPSKKEPAKHDVPKSLIPKREKSKEEFTLKSPPKGDRHKAGVMSPPKREKSKDEIPKSHIPVRQKSKDEFSVKSPPPKDTKHDATVFTLDKDVKAQDIKTAQKMHKADVKTTSSGIESMSMFEERFTGTMELMRDQKSDFAKSHHPESAPAVPTTKKLSEKDAITSTSKHEEVKTVTEKVLADSSVVTTITETKVITTLSKEEKTGDIIKKMDATETKIMGDVPITATKEADKPKVEPLKEADKAKVEPPKEADKPKVEPVKEVEKPKVEPSKEADKAKVVPTKEADADKPLFKKEKSIEEIPKSMIPKREKSKEEISVKSLPKDDKPKDLPTAAPKREKSIPEIPKSMIPVREKSKEEFSIKSPPKGPSPPKDDKPSDAATAAPKREKSIPEIPKSMIPVREKSKEEFSIKSPPKGPSPPKDDKPAEAAVSAPKREKSIPEIPKSMIPVREKSQDEFSIKSPKGPSPPKDNKPAEAVVSAPRREKSIPEIPKSMIPLREKSQEEFSIKSPPKSPFPPKDDKPAEAAASAPKREKSIPEIPKSMIPVREKSQEEFSIKSPPKSPFPPKDDKPAEAAASAPKREKSIPEIPKSMIPVREKSQEEFSIKSPPKSPFPPKDDKPAEAAASAPKREKSIPEIPKSMIPKREKSKEEFSIKSPPKGPSPPKDDKLKDDRPIDDKPKDAAVAAPVREKSIPEISKSMIPVREKSKEEFVVKLPSKDEKPMDATAAPKREKSIPEIPKSMIPVREKSKEEFSIISPPKTPKDDKPVDATMAAPKREKSIPEIPKSMIPVREKSKEEFSIKSPPKAASPPKDEKPADAATVVPKREKSIPEIPKSMIPVREKSKEEFSVKSPLKDLATSGPKREKSIPEIPKSMIPRREKSKDEFTLKSPPPKDDKIPSTALQREKSKDEIPKSMIPRREKSKEEFSIKSPPAEDKAGPKREKSIPEIPKSMIPRREKSRDEFSLKSPPPETTTSAPKREKSIGEIPKSMIPRREKSKDEFSIKSPPKDDTPKEVASTAPKREKSIGEIPKSMIPRREKSKDEFSVKSPPKREKSKDELPSSSIPKREKSKDEIPKSAIPKREKSKDEIPKSTIPKREKSKDEIPKSTIPKREKSKDEFSTKVLPKREKSKDEIPKTALPKREKSREEFSSKLAPKREKSKDELPGKSGVKRQDSKGESSPKPTPKKPDTTVKREHSKEEIASKSGVKRRDSKEESPKPTPKKSDTAAKSLPKREKSKEEIPKVAPKREKSKDDIPKFGPKREKSKDEIPKTPLAKRRDSKEESSKPPFKRPGSSSDSRSSSLKSETPSPKASDKHPKKDAKKEFETVTVTKKEKSEEVTTQEYEEHTRKQTSESQVYSGTFTGDPKEALKLLEDTSALKKADFVTSGSVITSKVDHKATTSLEKKEVKSSEIDTGDEKIIAHEEKEDIMKKETSASLLTKHSPDEKVEEKESKVKETTVSTTQKTLVNLTDDLETIQASASQMGKDTEHSIRARSVEDDEKIVTTEETASSLKDGTVGARVKVEKDLKDETLKKDDIGKIVEKSMFQEEITDSSRTFDVKEDFKTKSDAPSTEPSLQQKIKLPESGTIESEVYHAEMADDLTRQFTNMMQKSMGTLIQEAATDSKRDSISISEDITKDESSSILLSSSQAKIPDRDITMSPSSISEQIDIEELDDNDGKKISSTNVKDVLSAVDHMKIITKTTPEGKFISELSGARVLEILEPDNESQSRQDSMDVSSIEIDEVKFPSGSGIKGEVLHESPAVDSLNAMEKDIIADSVTLSEDTNIDFSLPQDSNKKQDSGLEKITIKRRTERDSFEIDSPPLVSPRMKIKELEIKPVNWMIGDEKIEVSEPLEPFQAFDKELEEYHKQQQQSQVDGSGKVPFGIPRIEETKSSSFEESESIKLGGKSKFTVIPVSEQDLDIDEELVENKLDISCQELMDTLQREYDAKTPTDDSRLEELAAKSFHFMTVDDDEDSFDYDKEKYEAEEQKKLADLPLETKTAVNVITGDQFMSLDEPLKPIGIIGKSKDNEMLQLYEEQFEETVQIKEDKKETKKEEKDTAKATDSGIESMNMFEEQFTGTMELMGDQKSDFIKSHLSDSAETVRISDKPDISDDEATKQSYDVEHYQQPAENSEMLLKMDTNKPDSLDKKDSVQLLSYKTFDPEEAKKQEEPHVTPAVQKPPRSDFVREKVDMRSKGWDDHKKREKSRETSPYKVKKEDFQNVDMSSRYAITVLDQVVKKEIAEVKENLEAAKQDLIEELSENSETMIIIKDSPSEFQFKLQPESIPNDLPFLYRPPSLEKVSDAENLSSSSSPIAKPRRHGELKDDGSSSESSSAEKKDRDLSKTSVVVESESDKSKESKDIFESFSTSSPKAASRSGSDAEGTAKDETFSLQPPQPAPRRRQKPSRSSHRHVTSESEADVSSSGESNYQSCEYEASSRPSSSDVEALQSAAMASSTTASEYETAMMSFEHSSSKATSQDYVTAATTLSSRESMKSICSLSSGQMGSIDSTSEISETLMASEPEMDKDEIDENLENILDDDMKTSNCASEDEGGKPFEMDPDVPCMMKRSSEMIFSQVINTESSSEGKISMVKQSDSSTLTGEGLGASTTASESADFVTAKSDEALKATPAQPIPTKQSSEATDDPSTTSSSELLDAKAPASESCSFEPDSLEAKYTPMSSVDDENGTAEGHGPGSGLTLQQQLSMTSSSMSGVSLETVIEKEAGRGSPDSDSFELVDKPDIIDDFVVVEEVGREAEEYDSEGKGIRISSMSYTSSKNYDRDVENLIAEKKDAEKPQAGSTRSTAELFDFESEESPPQASGDEQYSQSYSDDEQYQEGGKKWIEMQFQQNEARLYDIEYERGPLEDIKEEEVADFEAGSSRFGSVGSQKESIGSVGSMRGSYGSTPDNFDALTAKRYYKPTDHDNLSLSSLQEFEHLENAVALENAKRRAEQQHSSSQDSSSNGSLPRRYATSRSGHGDDISLSSVKDFEVLEKACKEAHLIELRAREEEDLLDHESPENRYKLESLARAKAESQGSAPGSFNPSTSGSDDYEKRIKEIDEIIRLAQANVEKIDRHDDTTEDISQIDLTDTDKPVQPITIVASETPAVMQGKRIKPPRGSGDFNPMETSTDSLELEGNGGRNYNVMCRSSDSLELKTTLDYPSLSSDSLNNVRDPKEEQEKPFSSGRRISSDSLEFPVLESQDSTKDDKPGKSSHSES